MTNGKGSLMRFFDDLGSLVEQRWRDKNYDEEVFPEIAAQALTETAPYQHVDPWEIIRWLYTTAQLPNQQDVPGEFGNPPITLYTGPRFYIDVYYWLDGTTSIHQHGFCGAFQVLLGSSILSEYRFEPEQRINKHFLAGQIKLNQIELLRQGDTRPIPPESKYIHSLFHLDRPSATTVIRTYSHPGEPQYSYLKPHFALDPFFKSQSTIKKLQSMMLLLNMKHPEADAMIGELLTRSDFQTTFSILDTVSSVLSSNTLENALGVSTGEKRFQALFEIARRRHGSLVDLIPPVFEEARRQNNLVHRRGQITSPEHRFFLALLLNVPDRRLALEMVSQRFPGQDPVETVIDWVEELANTKVWGSSEPNALGVENFDDDFLFVFRGLLEGLSLGQIKAAFTKECSGEHAEDLESKPKELFESFRNSPLFKFILFDSPSKAPASPGEGERKGRVTGWRNEKSVVRVNS